VDNHLHELNAINKFSEVAEESLQVFVNGLAEAILNAYIRDPHRGRHEPIDEWLDGPKEIEDMIGQEEGRRYAKWITIALMFVARDRADAFDLLNESLDRTSLSTRHVPMKLFVFEGTFSLCRTKWYEQHYGSTKLCDLRFKAIVGF